MPKATCAAASARPSARSGAVGNTRAPTNPAVMLHFMMTTQTHYSHLDSPLARLLRGANRAAVVQSLRVGLRIERPWTVANSASRRRQVGADDRPVRCGCAVASADLAVATHRRAAPRGSNRCRH